MPNAGDISGYQEHLSGDELLGLKERRLPTGSLHLIVGRFLFYEPCAVTRKMLTPSSS